MQICNCTVAIAGDAGNTVGRERVPVPELMVLRAVHGDDAVRNIELIGTQDIDSHEERERLMMIYRSPEGVVRETLGPTGALPKTLDESGIPDDFIIGGGKKAKTKKSSAVEPLNVSE